MKKILLLGGTGKMGKALNYALSKEYDVISVGSKDLNIRNEIEVREIIKINAPDVVINTAAFLGIDPCEQEPVKAFEMNMLHPMRLAKISNEFDFLLVHFSTDAVFPDIETNDSYDEYSDPGPVNTYGMTKLGGDTMVQEISKRHYIIRISILFGDSDKNNQFVEKMLSKVSGGASEINIADDVIATPCYSKDVALSVKNIIENDIEYGLYHVVNDGKGSLYDLMKEISCSMKDLSVTVNRSSHKKFPAIGKKNTNTPSNKDPVLNKGIHTDAWTGTSVNTLFCKTLFTDVDSYNSMTVCPGSHLYGLTPVKNRSIDENIMNMDHIKEVNLDHLEAGDVLVWHALLLHGTTGQSDKNTRVSVTSRFTSTETGFSSQERSLGYKTISVSPLNQILRLIGSDTLQPLRTYGGYVGIDRRLEKLYGYSSYKVDEDYSKYIK